MGVTKGECEQNLEPYEANMYYTYNSEKVSQLNPSWTYYIKETIEKNSIAEENIYQLQFNDGGILNQQGSYSQEECEEEVNSAPQELNASCILKYSEGQRYDKLLYSEVCGVEKGQEFCLSGHLNEVIDLVNQGIFTNEQCSLTTSSHRCTGDNVSIHSSSKAGIVEIRGTDGECRYDQIFNTGECYNLE